MQHPPRFWKHKESNEVIDNDTYRDLNELHRSDFDECDVTGELLPQGQDIDLNEIERIAAAKNLTGDEGAPEYTENTEI